MSLNFETLQPHLPVFRTTEKVQIQFLGLVKLRHNRDFLHHALVLTQKCEKILLRVADPQQHDEKMCLPLKTDKGQGLLDHRITPCIISFVDFTLPCLLSPIPIESNRLQLAITLQLRSSSPLL